MQRPIGLAGRCGPVVGTAATGTTAPPLAVTAAAGTPDGANGSASRGQYGKMVC
jgi:hypothetical protein